jgi:hypothetical protein
LQNPEDVYFLDGFRATMEASVKESRQWDEACHGFAMPLHHLGVVSSYS